MPSRTIPPCDGAPCVLQDEDAEQDLPRIEAQEVIRGQPCLEITSYTVHLDPDNEHEEDMELTDTICLSRSGWEVLVQMFAYRYPDAGARIVARAQGWQGHREA